MFGTGIGVLDGRVPVHDHRHVVLEERSALGHDHDADLARGREDLLALVAARLVVALDRDRAGRLHAAQVRARVVERVDLRLEVARGAVEDRAGREDARRADHPGARELGGREDLARVVARVVDRRDAEREPGVRHPVLLREDPVRADGAVPVRVDEARQDRLAGGVDRLRARGDRDVALLPDRLDAVALDDDHAVLDDLVALHRHDAAAREGDDVGRRRRVDRRLEGDVHPLRRRSPAASRARRAGRRTPPSGPAGRAPARRTSRAARSRRRSGGSRPRPSRRA